MIKAILFDADNTIYYTNKVTKNANMKAMRFFAKQTTKSSSYLHKERRKIVDKVKNSKDPKKRHLKYSYSKLAKKFNLKGANKAYKISIDDAVKNLKIEPTFKSSIKKLKGIKLAIVSEDYQNQLSMKLRKFKLENHFNAIITVAQAKTMKPSKIYYELAFKKLKIKPKDCVVVGDRFEADLKIPKQLGCKTVLFKKNDKRAHFSINNFNQLVEIINEVNS